MVDVKNLAFDSEKMLCGLRTWVECESPTFDAAAVNRMMDIAASDMAVMGANVFRTPGRMGFGDCIKGYFGSAKQDVPGILVLGHLDTVHPIGTLQKLPFRCDGAICYGPGLLDMKSGNYLALEAIRVLEAAGVTTKLPVTVMLTSDEEVGSPSTRDLIEAEAACNKYVLVPEPARRDGGVVTGRYCIARYRLSVTGKPSHAGLRPTEGVSAIREMANQIVTIHDLGDDDMTVSVGVVHGGQWVNCVATTCDAEILSMAKTNAALEASIQAITSLKAQSPGVTVDAAVTFTRPLWTTSDRDHALYLRAQTIAKELGFDIQSQYSAGGSDGNFTGALGIATLDGLGPRGDFPHTLDEHIVIESLAERGRLFAGLLATLD
jgi:glutamate carboxypeptidase